MVLNDWSLLALKLLQRTNNFKINHQIYIKNMGPKTGTYFFAFSMHLSVPNSSVSQLAAARQH